MNERTRIMIVDDELLLRNGLRYLIDWESRGFEIVAEASNGEDALSLAEKTRPDIVITDIVMPRMNGIDLTRSLKARFPQMRIIVLSGYDSFEYVKALFKLGVVDYLLKPTINKEELLALLRQISHSASDAAAISSAEQFIKEILYNTSFSHDQCLEGFRARGIEFRDGTRFLLLCGKPRRQSSGTLNRLMDSLAGIFSDARYAGCISDENRLFVLMEADDGAEAALGRFAAHVASHEPNAVFSRSSPFTDLGQLYPLYKSLCDILSYSFYDLTRPILTQGDIEIEPATRLDELPAGAREWGADAWREALISRIRTAAARLSPEPYALKLHIKDALYMLFQSLLAEGDVYKPVLSNKLVLFKRISQAAHADELIAVLEELFDSIDAQAELLKNDAGQMLVGRIKEYLRENYARDLKLSEVAKEFHVSYSHCSFLFHKYTGVHFTDYLTQLRVDKASQLLRTGMSIQAVSERTGFVNQSYFARIFKSIQGISPKQFQKTRKDV